MGFKIILRALGRDQENKSRTDTIVVSSFIDVHKRKNTFKSFPPFHVVLGTRANLPHLVSVVLKTQFAKGLDKEEQKYLVLLYYYITFTLNADTFCIRWNRSHPDRVHLSQPSRYCSAEEAAAVTLARLKTPIVQFCERNGACKSFLMPRAKQGLVYGCQ